MYHILPINNILLVGEKVEVKDKRMVEKDFLQCFSVDWSVSFLNKSAVFML